MEPLADIKLDIELMVKEYESIRHLFNYVKRPGTVVVVQATLNVIRDNNDVGILELIPYTSSIVNELRSKYDFDTVMYRTLMPNTCYRWHTDYGDVCFNIPITTNVGSRFVFEDRAFHMPADGTIYVVNQGKQHTFANSGDTMRTHLMFENHNQKTIVSE